MVRSFGFFSNGEGFLSETDPGSIFSASAAILVALLCVCMVQDLCI